MLGLFFLQAEDGIRDFHVTGVQTCALPISMATTPRFCASSTSSSQGRCHNAEEGWDGGDRRSTAATADLFGFALAPALLRRAMANTDTRASQFPSLSFWLVTHLAPPANEDH